MSANMLQKSLTTAEALRTRCQTEPDLNAYQPLVTSAVEVCVSAAPESRKKLSSLAAHAVKKTAALIENGANFPLTPEYQLGLENFERALDSIRRYIESIPERSSRPSKFKFSAVKFDRESWHLRGNLNASYKDLIELPKKPKSVVPSGASRTEGILEIAAFGTRAAAAICDVPVPGLAFGKPAVAIVGLICETVKTVKSNRTAAESLARHAQSVTNSVVARAGPAVQGDSLLELHRALQQVQDFLTILRNRRRFASWMFALKEKDRFNELNIALDRALQVFTASAHIGTAEIVRGNTQQLITVVATVNRVEGDVQRMMSLVHSTVKEQAPNATPKNWLSVKLTAFVPFSFHQQTSYLFF